MPQNKPLFIPLRKQHFEDFDRGTKTNEYRPYGPRWNERTCPPGREVILSYGYGVQRRIKAKIAQASISDRSPAFIEIYGKEKQCFAISLIELQNI